MLKGCQREMILLQTKESPLFECAYFVLRRGRAAATHTDMMAEANRIIGQGRGYLSRRRKKWGVWLFLMGVLAGAGIFALCCAFIP